MDYTWLAEYLKSKKGTVQDFKIEWQWERYLLKNKMYASICKNKAEQDIITLKLEPSYGISLREEYEEVTDGYYMNKVHWNSVLLEGNFPVDLLKKLIDQSYELVFASLTKKLQLEISG